MAEFTQSVKTAVQDATGLEYGIFVHNPTAATSEPVKKPIAAAAATQEDGKDSKKKGKKTTKKGAATSKTASNKGQASVEAEPEKPSPENGRAEAFERIDDGDIGQWTEAQKLQKREELGKRFCWHCGRVQTEGGLTLSLCSSCLKAR